MTETQPPTTTKHARGSVAAAQEALDRHDATEAARRAAADGKRQRLVRELAEAEDGERRATRAAEFLRIAEHAQAQAETLTAAIAARQAVIDQADAEVAQAERQRAEIATADAADQTEIERLLAVDDIDAAAVLAARRGSRTHLAATLADQAARARARRAAAVTGTGPGDSLSDLTREQNNAAVGARNARAEAKAQSETVAPAPPAPVARPVPPARFNATPTTTFHRARTGR